MFGQITLGQFVPGQSLLHRLNPVTKILAVLLTTAAVFIAPGWSGLGLAAAYVLFISLLVGRLAVNTLKGLKPLWVLMAFTFLFQAFTVPGDALLAVGFIKITVQGVERAVFLIGRIVLVVLLTSILTITTSPLLLTRGIESLLSPFKKIGLPAHELAMMMTIALRFIPTLLMEAEIVIKAQRSRGSDFTHGSFTKRIKALIPFIVPLIAGSLRKAEDLAVAMESRCYRGGINRTYMHKLSMGAADYPALAVSAAFFVLTVLMRLMGW